MRYDISTISRQLDPAQSKPLNPVGASVCGASAVSGNHALDRNLSLAIATVHN